MTLFDQFDRIRIINLAERTDRRRDMDKELRRLGLLDDRRVEYFPAIRPTDMGSFTSIGARGVYEGQKMLLREAASAGQSILILEDDCRFRDGAASYATDVQWDIFYGGYDAGQPDDLINSDIVGAHMMGFSVRGAKLVSEYLEALTYDGIHPPIDAAYIWFRRAHPEVPTHFAVPPLATQRASRSDIADPKPWDRIAMATPLVGFLRRIKNRLRPRD